MVYPVSIEEERAIVEAFNAARPNATLNANEKAVMQMIRDGNMDGLERLLQAGRAVHFLGIGDCLYYQETPLMACLNGRTNHIGQARTMRATLLMIEYGADIN